MGSRHPAGMNKLELVKAIRVAMGFVKSTAPSGKMNSVNKLENLVSTHHWKFGELDVELAREIGRLP
jgi:hypothetical protein